MEGFDLNQKIEMTIGDFLKPYEVLEDELKNMVVKAIDSGVDFGPMVNLASLITMQKFTSLVKYYKGNAG